MILVKGVDIMLKGFKRSVLTAALVYIVIGLMLIIWPMQAKMFLCYAVGAVSLLIGLGSLARYFTRPGYGVFSRFGMVIGVVLSVIGLLLLFNAKAIIAAIGIIIGAAVLIDSIMRLQMALDAKRSGLRWQAPMIMAGIMLIVGVVLLFDPFGGLDAATRIAGWALLIEGVMSLISTGLISDIFRR